MVELRVPEVIWRREAIDAVRRYFGRCGTGESAYTGAWFESFEGGGDRASASGQFTCDDLVAVSMLSVHIPARAAVALRGGRAAECHKLLSAVPRDLDLVDADGGLIGPDSAAWRLWTEVEGLSGIGPTIASKLLARKRPRLLPVYDDLVAGHVGYEVRTYWCALRDVLHAENRRLQRRLEAIRDEAQVECSAIRVFDIVAWMDARALVSECRGEEKR